MALDSCPGVHESAVVGAPDPEFGERVVAFVVGDGSADLDTDELLAQLRSQLATFKVPRSVVVIDQLPRNSMGKIQKSVLRNID